MEETQNLTERRQGISFLLVTHPCCMLETIQAPLLAF